MEVFSIKLHDEKHIGRFRESFSNSIRKYSALKIYANIDMDTVYLKLPNSPQYIKCTVNKELRDQWTRYYWSFLSGMGIKHLEFGSIVDLNILDCVKNSVESLHLWNSKINYPEKVQTIEWKKLKKLFVCVWESKLESFFPDTIEKLGFDQSLSADQMKFINKQKDLKDLSVKCDSCCQNEDLGSCQLLKLEKLTIRSAHARLCFDSFKNTFQFQFASLKILVLHKASASFQDFARIINQMKRLEVLEFKAFGFNSNESQVDDTMTEVSCPTLKCWRLAPYFIISVAQSNQLIKGFPSLEKLSFEGSYPGFISSKVSQYIQNMKELKFFEFIDAEFKDVCMPNLTRVTIDSYTDRPLKFDNLFRNCPELQQIEVFGRISDADFGTLLKKENLKELHIHDGFDLTANVFEMYEHLLKNLKVLKICRYSPLTETGKSILNRQLGLNSYITNELFSDCYGYDRFMKPQL